MAKHDSTELLALAVRGNVDSSPVTSSAHHPLSDPGSKAAGPVLGLIQVEVMKNVFMRRVNQAVATIPNVTWHREAIISSFDRIGAGLFSTFAVKAVEDIPSNQFAAACQFIESFVLDFGAKAQMRA
jgi:hypothetical protein